MQQGERAWAERRRPRPAGQFPRLENAGNRLDAASPAAARERRPSLARLAASLRPALATPAERALCLPLCLLFSRHIRFDAADPLWADRDRLVLAPGLEDLGAAVAARTGAGADLFEAPLAIWPAGPWAAGVGLALAEKLLTARFGRSLVDHRTWIFAAGDELATGEVQELAWLAGAWRLGRLAAIAAVDNPAAPGLAGFAAAGWSVRRVDANEPGEMPAAISAALRAQKPTLIACAGAIAENDAPSGAAPADAALAAEGTVAWQAAGGRNAGVRRAWLRRLGHHTARPDFETALAGRLAVDLPSLADPAATPDAALAAYFEKTAGQAPELAHLPGPGTSHVYPAAADLPDPWRKAASRMIQGLAGCAAGLGLHGGIAPVIRASLGTAERTLPALRQAAAAGTRLICVLTDAPAPGAHPAMIAALRTLPNLLFCHPGDTAEALECAELALRRAHGPAALLVPPAALPPLAERPAHGRCARGGYVLAEAATAWGRPAPRAATLIASGPELHAALAARALLGARGVAVAVVSLPCWSLFAQAEPRFQDAVLGEAPRLALEAGGGLGWEKWTGPDGFVLDTETQLRKTQAEAGLAPAGSAVAELLLRHLGLRLPH